MSFLNFGMSYQKHLRYLNVEWLQVSKPSHSDPARCCDRSERNKNDKLTEAFLTGAQ